MFCYKCGKEIAEKSTFCTYCGAKQDFAMSSVPIPSETPRSNLDPTPSQPLQSFPLPTEPASDAPVPPAETAAPAERAEPVQPLSEPDQPAPEQQSVQPNQPEQSEQSEQAKQPQPVSPEQPESSPFSTEVPLTAPAPETLEKPRKYYTGAHLAICLVMTGIMAATAGIFAGLYFSVI